MHAKHGYDAVHPKLSAPAATYTELKQKEAVLF